VSGFEFWQTWMLRVVALAWSACCSPCAFQDWRLFRPIKRTRRRAPREKLLYVPQ
jgi:hypothetical protein